MDEIGGPRCSLTKVPRSVPSLVNKVGGRIIMHEEPVFSRDIAAGGKLPAARCHDAMLGVSAARSCRARGENTTGPILGCSVARAEGGRRGAGDEFHVGTRAADKAAKGA